MFSVLNPLLVDPVGGIAVNVTGGPGIEDASDPMGDKENNTEYLKNSHKDGNRLEEEELLKLEPVPRLLELSVALREMDSAQGHITVHEAVTLPNPSGQDLGVRGARSRLLRCAIEPHCIDEATVSRNGLRVRLTAQRARWVDGSTHFWLGWETAPGPLQRDSGLRFDFLEER